MAGQPPGAPAIVLASASRARATMLEAAGVPFAIDAAAIDEDDVKAALVAERATPAQVAETLAELKALRVARRHPGSLVIGADQVLAHDDALFDKPKDRADAARQLATLAGKSHRLYSVAVVVRDGARLWHHGDMAELTMRPLTAEFIDQYLDRAGDAVTQSVGAYQLEGLGAQLFTRVRGDFFTVLGLPLLPLLGFLRGHGVVPA
ncbi:MAG: Maf family protein [Rhodospirillaceae bacterium]|nr:Maf family protein [Rhodospirillaceae bacterium]